MRFSVSISIICVHHLSNDTQPLCCSCFNPGMLPTRRPHPRSSFAWRRASPWRLPKQWQQGTLPGRRTSSIQPTWAARLFQTCSPPARLFFFFTLSIEKKKIIENIGRKVKHCSWIWSVCLSVSQQAAYHPEVSEEVKNRALMFGSECTTGYIDLLEQVLLVGWTLCHCVSSETEKRKTYVI